MVITLDCDATPVFQIKTHRLKGGKLETSHYKVTVSRFRARLSITISYNSLKGEMKVEGYPDVSFDHFRFVPIFSSRVRSEVSYEPIVHDFDDDNFFFISCLDANRYE